MGHVIGTDRHPRSLASRLTTPLRTPFFCKRLPLEELDGDSSQRHRRIGCIFVWFAANNGGKLGALQALGAGDRPLAGHVCVSTAGAICEISSRLVSSRLRRQHTVRPTDWQHTGSTTVDADGLVLRLNPTLLFAR
jgi:hypothetical protein